MAASSPSPFRYLKAAFNARTHVKGLGGIPVNWLGLGVVAVLSLLNPGFLVLGAAGELAYLAALSQSKRFRKLVDGKRLLALEAEGERKKGALVDRLAGDDRARYQSLVDRTDTMAAAKASSSLINPVITGGLARLHEIYLQLLTTRAELSAHLGLATDVELETKLAEQQARVASIGPETDVALRRSAEETLRILERRVGNRRSARQRLDFIESELLRVEQQAELVIEEAALSRDPGALSQRIDAVTATYDDTLAMMRTYSAAEDAALDLA